MASTSHPKRRLILNDDDDSVKRRSNPFWFAISSSTNPFASSLLQPPSGRIEVAAGFINSKIISLRGPESHAIPQITWTLSGLSYHSSFKVNSGQGRISTAPAILICKLCSGFVRYSNPDHPSRNCYN